MWYDGHIIILLLFFVLFLVVTFHLGTLSVYVRFVDCYVNNYAVCTPPPPPACTALKQVNYVDVCIP